MKFQNGQLPTTPTDDSERLLRAELSLLMRNATGRIERYRRRGFKVSFDRFAAICDGDALLARRVLLAAGWCPGEDGNWITGQGFEEISRVISWDVLESTIESILDDYRPVEEARAAAA
jgi:hypothetical protein